MTTSSEQQRPAAAPRSEYFRLFFLPPSISTAILCYLVACVVFFAFTTVVFFFLWPAEHDITMSIDFWEHVASLKQLMANPIHPLHPQYATHDQSREYMPWYLALAIFGRTFGWEPLRVMALGASLTTILVLLGIGLFFREYFENDWAPVTALFCLLFLWGTPWVWSSFYNFRSYLTTAAYPSTFVFGIALVLWWVAMRVMRSSSPLTWEPLTVALLMASAMLIHQLSATFAAAALGCLLIGERSPKWRRKAVLVVSVAAGMALTIAWPYFNPWQLASKDQVWNPLWAPLKVSRFYRPIEVLACIGPAAAGLMAIAVFTRTRTHLSVVLGFTGALSAYVIGGALGNPMAHRVLILVIFWLHVGLIWLLLASFRRKKARDWKWFGMISVLAIIVSSHIGLVSLELAHVAYPDSVLRRLPIHHYFDVVGSFRSISRFLSPDSIIMADFSVCKAVPAFQGRVVSVYWTSPLVQDDEKRGRDAERFFAITTSADERRRIIARYSVTHILYQVTSLPSAVRELLCQVANEQTDVNGIILMKVKR